jgi:hypothetical protein
MTLLEKYNSPTPNKWRKLGNFLLILSTTITSYSIMEEMKGVAIGAAILGCIGKVLTDFFTEDTTQE